MAKIKQFTEADGALNGYKIKIDEVDGKYVYLLQDPDGQKFESENKSETYESAKEAFKAAKAELKEKVGDESDEEETSTDNAEAENTSDTSNDSAEGEEEFEDDNTTEAEDDNSESETEITSESIFDKLFKKIISENNLVNEWDQFVQDAQPEELPVDPNPNPESDLLSVEDIMSEIDACDDEQCQNDIIDRVKAERPELFEDLIGALQAAADGANEEDPSTPSPAYYQSLANYAMSIR